MLPSDHFVRFYNEVFKFLQEMGQEHLDAYYAEISRHQELHCLELFRQGGLRGMYDYWHHIGIEENCDLSLELDENHFHVRMNCCPSITKAIDNDAGLCEAYCDHCPGWKLPLIAKAGFFAVSNLIDRRQGVCDLFVYKEHSPALAKYRELLAEYDISLLGHNLDILL